MTSAIWPFWLNGRRTSPPTALLGSKGRFDKTGYFYLAPNILGIIFYLRFASLIWAPSTEKGLYGGPGDPIIWVVFAFPFLLFFSALNLFILVSAFVRAILYKHWSFFFVVIGVVIGWIAAFSYDASRQFDGSWIQTDHPIHDR
jgi:hypothetical protein